MKNAYTFNFVAGENEQRFLLHFGPLGLGESESSNISIYSYLHTVYIKLNNQIKGDVFIYNISGQLVSSRTGATGTAQIDVAVAGNYIVKVITNKTSFVKRVVVQ